MFELGLLVGNKNLPAVQYIRQSDAAVVLPLLQDLKVIDVDNEVLRLALVEDLASCAGATSHDGIIVVED